MIRVAASGPRALLLLHTVLVVVAFTLRWARDRGADLIYRTGYCRWGSTSGPYVVHLTTTSCPEAATDLTDASTTTAAQASPPTASSLSSPPRASTQLAFLLQLPTFPLAPPPLLRAQNTRPLLLLVLVDTESLRANRCERSRPQHMAAHEVRPDHSHTMSTFIVCQWPFLRTPPPPTSSSSTGLLLLLVRELGSSRYLTLKGHSLLGDY